MEEQQGQRTARSSSFLVRFWLEDREQESAEPILRGCVRNLRTGEEHLVRNTQGLGEQILRFLDNDLTLREVTLDSTGEPNAESAVG